MGLERYRAKRRFARTPEPRGRVGPRRRRGLRFVVQKHAASRLHYDFRLELGGTLKSWAVPKGPSLIAGDKRLAVEVEDHPLEYADFEGSIPPGEYGGGTVMVWDRGTWEPGGDPELGLSEGKLELVLHGKKLRGGYVLVRMRTRGEAKPAWLLIKGRDAEARSSDVLAEQPDSAKSGRSLEEIARDRRKVWHSARASVPVTFKQRARALAEAARKRKR
jgi:bifunctional non-homologous end joining protein LigD